MGIDSSAVPALLTLLWLPLAACSSDASEVPVPTAPPAAPSPAQLHPSSSKVLVPRNELNTSLVLTPDLAHLARIRRADAGTWEVLRDGQVVAEGLLGVLEGTPVLSPDGRRLAWGERVSDGWRVVVDGEETLVGQSLGKVGIAVSRDGHLAWQVQVDGGWRVVLDGVPGPVWADVGPPVLSPAGGHLVYAAAGPDGPVLVRDGDASPLSGEPIAAAFSADGAVLGRVVRSADGYRFEDSARTLGPHPDMGTPVFAPVGARWSLPVHDEGVWKVLVDGVEVSRHDQVGHPGPTFDPSGQHVAWWARDGDAVRVLRDGEAGRAWRAIGDLAPVWSADGQHLAWLASTADEQGTSTWHVVVDDIPFLAREQVAALALSADGAHVAWVGQEAEGWAVRIGRTRDGRVWTTPGSEGVGTDWGGGIAFVGGVLRYTAIDELGLSVHEVALP